MFRQPQELEFPIIAIYAGEHIKVCEITKENFDEVRYRCNNIGAYGESIIGNYCHYSPKNHCFFNFEENEIQILSR